MNQWILQLGELASEEREIYKTISQQQVEEKEKDDILSTYVMYTIVCEKTRATISLQFQQI